MPGIILLSVSSRESKAKPQNCLPLNIPMCFLQRQNGNPALNNAGLGHRSAHPMWSMATRRRFPNHAATSRSTPQTHPTGWTMSKAQKLNRMSVITNNLPTQTRVLLQWTQWQTQPKHSHWRLPNPSNLSRRIRLPHWSSWMATHSLSWTIRSSLLSKTSFNWTPTALSSLARSTASTRWEANKSVPRPIFPTACWNGLLPAWIQG